MKKDVVVIEEMGAVVDDAVDGPDGQAVEADERPFILNKWNGLTQWRCRFCAWDTLDGEAEAMDHYIARHAAPVAPAPSPILRVDRFGRPVV